MKNIIGQPYGLVLILTLSLIATNAMSECFTWEEGKECIPDDSTPKATLNDPPPIVTPSSPGGRSNLPSQPLLEKNKIQNDRLIKDAIIIPSSRVME
jgi:hypothetical protein